MPEFLEKKIEASEEKRGVPAKRARSIAFATMNKRGLVHGSKITAKGRQMEKKHASDVKKGLARG